MPSCSTTCWPSGADRSMPGFVIQPDSVATGHYVGVLSAANAPLRDAVNEILQDAMRDGTLERIFRKWEVWNDDQPPLHARVLAGDPLPPFSGLELTSDAARESMVGRGAPLSAGAAAGVGGDAGALRSGDGAGRDARRADREWPGVRQRGSLRAALLGLRRGHARHAGPPAAVRSLLRHRRSHPAAGIRGGAARPGAELRGVRERDLPRGPRGGVRRGSSKPDASSASASGSCCG